MSVLTQAFLTLVRSHLMSLMLLSVRHNYKVLKGFLFAYLRDESLRGLEGGNIVGRDHDGRVLGDVASGLLGTGLHREAAEATEIDILPIGKRILHTFHETFNNTLHFDSFNACAFRDFIYDFSLCHGMFLLIWLMLKVYIARFEGCKNRSIFLIIKKLLRFF